MIIWRFNSWANFNTDLLFSILRLKKEMIYFLSPHSMNLTDAVWDNTKQSAWLYWKQGQVYPFPTGRGKTKFQILTDVPTIIP